MCARHVLFCSSLVVAIFSAVGCGSSVKDPLEANLDKNGVAKAFAGTWVADVDFGTSPNGQKDTKHYELTFTLNPTSYSNGTFTHQPSGVEGSWTVLETRRDSNGGYSGRAEGPTPGKWDFAELSKSTFTQNAGGGLKIKWTRK
jgi:hypothetical protein